ncbi:efflux transporter outer membrane subunit [Erwinia amylovora]|uniref:efflux transporter outer membrane subunit n=1 Tax=Erwinia amylovora TaxID=552 RepID=UPI00200B0B16|nr:efflux transporter outer membrane subunit [Erwinia amylovora]MCK8155146.1 efflux transporter outer membrane subunit [Erwinia amylovora]MCK8159133.1 efflux transporter outer membrane subunit [Erwinia amylovora]MCK8165928.1 efflux transporter outer membrane subunit [Erwinia amylovora]MCK8172584.1 efflux transporter outer membrane subunit [Erwinia amylovora]MCK8175284.1 efflux transporter outer membrane subunit [Erwinia amylovora]
MKVPCYIRRSGNGVLIAAALSLGGCAPGPDYQPPRPVTPEVFNSMPPQGGAKILPSAPRADWWKAFGDPQLNSLIERAVQGNLSLQQTVLRIAGARQQLDQARGAWAPSASGNARFSRQQLGIKGELESQGVDDRLNGMGNADSLRPVLDSLEKPIGLYKGSFDASWELDLWGKVRRQVEMADARQQQSVEERNDALVSLEAEVARAYLQLRGAQAITRTIETQIDVAQLMLELTRSQQQNGLAPQTNVENARAQLSSLRAQLPHYQAQIHQAMNGLAVLTGKVPGALDAELTPRKALTLLPPAVPVGVPSELARRRPDVRAAEASLHAATASIGVSVAQLFPSLSLSGQFGVRNSDASYLDRWSSNFYSFGPSITLPIFQGGRLVSGVKLARAQQASAALQYRQTVLTALQDVENALVSYRSDLQQVTGLDDSAQALQNACNLASVSYRQGLSSFIEPLDAQRQLAQLQQQAEQARVQSLLDLVALYKALGGGWESWQKVHLPDYPVFGAAEKP